MSKLIRDICGSSLVEFTIVFPVLMLVALGTVDVGLMLSDWTLANSATYRGVRAAIVSAPVATGITNPTYDGTLLGNRCFNPADGTASGSCPSLSSTCTGAASNGTCTNGYAWDETAFLAIYNRMHNAYPRLTRQNVQIAYSTDNLGFNGRPDGLPMNITVTIKCATHQLYFLPAPALGGWAFTQPQGCSGSGMPMPQFATTFPSEDMVTN